MNGKSTVHLIVEAGPDKGKEITLTRKSARLGRSSKNDIVLADPSLSRFHCRFSLKPGEGLWVTDLGSANQTLVNDAPAQDVRLKKGDRIAVGDSVLRVVDDASHAAPSVGEDLFGRRPPEAASATTPSGAGRALPARRLLLWGVAAAAILALAGVALLRPGGKPAAASAPEAIPAAGPAAPARTLEIAYEKVHGTPDNFFRYFLKLDDKGKLAIQIDDIANNQHIRKEAVVLEGALRSLAESIQSLGFFELDESYRGIQPKEFDQWDLSVTIGSRTHRAVVVNRLEPDGFKAVRERIEEFGKNELSLAAVALPPEKLLALARDAALMGQKLYAERNVQDENLHESIKHFAETEWYLESIEPKPDFYADAVSGRKEAERDLQERCETQLFLANKAVRNREWAVARAALETICRMVPDRSDKRYKEAYAMLVDVQRRMAEETKP